MKSNRSCFSRTIFLNQLKRFWPLYAAYLVIWLLVLVFPLNSSLQQAMEYGQALSDITLSTAYHLIYVGQGGGLIMPAVFSVLFAMAAFHYLYNNRGVSMMCSLPVKREGVFLSAFLPGLSVMLVSNLITFLLAMAVASSYGVSVAGYAMQAFAMVSLQCIFFYGFAAFCAMLTGHILVLPAVYAVLNVAVVGAVYLIYLVLNKFVYGLILDIEASSFLFYLSPVVYILGMTSVHTQVSGVDGMNTTGYSYDGWTYLIVLAVVGLAFMVGAMLLLRRRRMETAGDVVAVKTLKPVFKYCLTLACALGAGLGLYYLIMPYGYSEPSVGFGDMAMILAFMLIGAFVGYFAAEMLIKKTLRVFAPRNWKGLGAAALIIVALVFVCEFDVLGYERRVPDSDDVEYATLTGSGYVEISAAEDIDTLIGIHSGIVANKAKHESVVGSGHSYVCYIEYALKDGSFMSRRYYLNDAEHSDLAALVEFLNTPAMILARNDPGVAVTDNTISEAYVSCFDAAQGYYSDRYLTVAETYELYTTCILPDLEDGTIGLISTMAADAEHERFDSFFMACNISIHLNERQPNGEYEYGSINIKPTVDSVRTNKWLAEHGFELLTRAEVVGTVEVYVD